MRRYLYLIVSHPEDEYVGQVEAREKRYETAVKNEERRIDKRNVRTGESYSQRVVSLGFHDFDDREDYEENFVEVVQRKLTEIDKKHLADAGLEAQEVGPDATA